MSTLHPKFKLWLSTAAHSGAFGDGKWRLLEAIRASGSLRKAAETLGISYRKAWGDLKKAEQALNTVLVTRRRGGRDGGEMKLTDAGEQLLAHYVKFRAGVHDAVEEQFDRHLRGVL